VLALVSVWLLIHSRRERLALAVFDQSDVESSALLLILVCGAVFLVAVVASPALDGPWYAARDTLPALACGAALCAWGYRRFPRIGNALALVTLVGTAVLLVAGRL
jgi:peptidoglycan/LPS O-acetylase OafA/YrhL